MWKWIKVTYKRQILVAQSWGVKMKSPFLNHLFDPFNDSIKNNAAFKNILENHALFKKQFIIQE